MKFDAHWKWIPVLAIAIGIAGVVVANNSGNFGKLANFPGNVHLTVLPTNPPTVNSGMISGRFEGRLSFSGDPGSTGGACLIFQEKNNTKECSSDSECTIYMPLRVDEPSSGWPVTQHFVNPLKYGYCGIEGTCWHKPLNDRQHCTKMVDIAGKHVLGPVDLYSLGKDKAMRWRVMTCQNINPQGCKNGQEGVDKRTRYGEFTEFPAEL